MCRISYARFAIPLILAATSLPAQQAEPTASKIAYITSAEAHSHLQKQVDPIFPAPAQAAHLQGMVDLQIAIDETGRPTATVITGDPMLAQAAMDAVAQWRYQPFERDGQPIPVTTEVAMWIPANSHQIEMQRENDFLSAYWPAKTQGIDALNNHDLDTASKELLLAHGAAESQGDEKWHDQALVSAALGNTELGLKNYSEAEKYFTESLTLYQDHGTGEEAEAGDAMEEFANVYAAQNDSAKAEPLLLHAVKIYKDGMKTASSDDDRAWYGRHLAVSSFWLVAIATSSHRPELAQARCADLKEYATKYMGGDQRDIMLKGCTEVTGKGKNSDVPK